MKKFMVMAPLFMVLVIDVMGFGLVFPILASMFTSKAGHMMPANLSEHLRNLLYGASLISFSVALFFGAPFLGDLSDKVGRKKILLACLFGESVGLALSAVAILLSSLTLFLISRVMTGYFAGCQPIAQAAIVDISAPEERGKNLSLITFAVCIGFALGPVVAGLLVGGHDVSWTSFAKPFVLAAVLAFLNGVCLIFTLKETYVPRQKHKVQLGKGLSVFVSAFKDKQVQQLSIAFLLFMCGWTVYFQYVSLYLAHTFHYAANNIGHFMGWMGVIFGTTLLFVVPWLITRFNPSRLLMFSLGITGLTIGISSVHSEWLQWVIIVPLGMSAGIAYMTSITGFSNAVDETRQGWVMGVSGAVVAAGWVFATLIASAIGELGFSTLFIVGGFLTIIAGWVSRVEKKSEH